MKTGIPDESSTVYGRLADEIQRQIEGSTFPPDGFIDSEHGLVRKYKVARLTVRRATEVLIQRGLITRRPGKGLYICRPDEKREKVIWVLLENLAWEPCIRLARGVQEWSKQYRYVFEMKDGQAETSRNLQLLQDLADQEDVDGALIMAWHTPEFFEAVCRLKDKGLPLVVIDHHNAQVSVPNVVSDNYHGGWLAAEHLYELGHRVFAFIGDYTAQTVRNRLDGFRDYLAEKGIVLPHSRVGDVRPDDRFVDWSAWVDDRMGKVMSGKERPTGLFVSCDSMARSVYRYCERNGIKIPDDLSIVSFDNDPASQWMSPELTTIAQPFSQMGEAAMKLLDSQLNGTPWNRRETILPVELVVRKSTKTIRRRK